MQVRQGRETNWIFTAVYVYLHQRDREVIWTELRHFGTTTQQPLEAPFLKLTAEQQEGFSASFTSHEALTALKSMATLKAPGPDGYHAYFFQQYWTIAGNATY